MPGWIVTVPDGKGGRRALVRHGTGDPAVHRSSAHAERRVEELQARARVLGIKPPLYAIEATDRDPS